MSDDRPPGHDPIAAADRLAGALDGMTAELRTVTARQADAEKYGRRNRAMIWLALTSVAAVVVLTVLLVFVYGSAQNAATAANVATAKVTAQHQNLLSACQEGNASRAAQVALWDHVLGETSGNLNLKTATGRQLLAYIRVAFRARNCAVLYKLP